MTNWYYLSYFLRPSQAVGATPQFLTSCKYRKLGRGGTWPQSYSSGIKLAEGYELRQRESNVSEIIFLEIAVIEG